MAVLRGRFLADRRARHAAPTCRPSSFSPKNSAAAGAYGTAVEDGRFAEVSEYQDSHGFLVAARELWRGAAETVRRSRPASYERVAAALATFKRALPTPLPPP